MKSKFLFVIFLFSAFFCFAEKVDLTFILNDKSTWVYSVEKDVKTLVLYTTKQNSPLPTADFSDIKGFDQLENLTHLVIYGARCTGDYSFLYDIKKLRRLGLISCYINSLNFLSNLSELENTEVWTITNIAYKNKIETEEINLEKLKKIEKIQISIAYLDGTKITNLLERVPPFINVQNKPELLLYNNNICELTEKDKNYCNQYSKVSFNGNPIEEKIKAAQ